MRETEESVCYYLKEIVFFYWAENILCSDCEMFNILTALSNGLRSGDFLIDCYIIILVTICMDSQSTRSVSTLLLQLKTSKPGLINEIEIIRLLLLCYTVLLL